MQKNKGSRILILALALSAASASAKEPAVSFDQGVNVPRLLEDLKARAGTVQEVAASSYRTERDCASVVFRKDDPLVSPRVHLVSREYRDVCHTGPQGRVWCREEVVWTEHRSVRVEISGRGEMLPWERDVFEVCLDGRWLRAWTVDASHEYSLSDRYGDLIEARALRKTRSMPDPGGISAESFRFDPASANFTLELKDRWIRYYQGESVGLELEIKRHRDNWFDETVLSKSLTLPAAESLRVKFADYVSEVTGSLKPGREYYVKWRFKRIGAVSKDKWVSHRETEKATYQGGQIDPKQTPAPEHGGFSAQAMNGDLVAKACWIRGVENNQCVYRCRDGSTHRTPLPESPDGQFRGCPQVVIPFWAQAQPRS